jgi:uncharacterized Zn-binding protein involved in type VI secretion
MGKCAACIGDMHSCPVSSPIMHMGGPVIGPGATTVLFEGKPAARVGDSCICVGVTDQVVAGSSGVFVEGKPAVRVSDRCAHGGMIVTGCATVLIGESKPGVLRNAIMLNAYGKRDKEKGGRPFRKPPPAVRRKLFLQAVQDATDMLQTKLRLLRKRDAETMKSFKKWFGRDDEKAWRIIVDRTRRALSCMRGLGEGNFTDIMDLKLRKENYAIVMPVDMSHMISLGNPFWQAPATGPDSKAGILVHEVSHFEDVEGTKDYEYGRFYCLRLATFMPDRALFNADNFERFIES